MVGSKSKPSGIRQPAVSPNQQGRRHGPDVNTPPLLPPATQHHSFRRDRKTNGCVRCSWHGTVQHRLAEIGILVCRHRWPMPPQSANARCETKMSHIAATSTNLFMTPSFEAAVAHFPSFYDCCEGMQLPPVPTRCQPSLCRPRWPDCSLPPTGPIAAKKPTRRRQNGLTATPHC